MPISYRIVLDENTAVWRQLIRHTRPSAVRQAGARMFGAGRATDIMVDSLAKVHVG